MDQKKLEQFRLWQRKLHACEHVMSLLQYDAATSMPEGAADAMGDTMEIMAGEQYALTTDPGFGTLLEEIYGRREELDFRTRREAEELHEQREKTARIPKEEVMRYEKAVADGNHYWEIAKRTNNYALFQPYLARLIELKKARARFLNPEGDAYDTLIDEFEKGMTQEKLDPFFDLLREKLVPVIRTVTAAKEQPDFAFLHAAYPIEEQKKLSLRLMEVMGVDQTRCVLGESEHPFTTEFSRDDVRITTKYMENDLFSNLFSVIHESGHAMYELQIDRALRHSVMGHGSTAAIHESQSRLWENFIARSEPFCEMLLPILQELFPTQFGNVNAGQLYRAVNLAQPGLIRTEADELTYSLHVLIRYELEKQLFHDRLAAEELPAAWNRLYKEYLGVDVPDDTRGVLQDAHWAGGLFGYFPGYALGTAYAAQIMHHMEKQLDPAGCCRRMDFSPVSKWLGERIHRHGMLLTAEELILEACKEPFDPRYFIDYLTRKYTSLYRPGP